MDDLMGSKKYRERKDRLVNVTEYVDEFNFIYDDEYFENARLADEAALMAEMEIVAEERGLQRLVDIPDILIQTENFSPRLADS